MKHLLTMLLFIALVFNAQAQAPQGIPYQAAARNSSGAVLASTAISLRFTIRDSVATGAIKYRETFSVTTTAQGMFSVNVGQGTVVSGSFAGINWGTNAKFMQVEMDPAGGASYIDMGTTQMMSVPYTLNSGSVQLKVSATGDTLYSGGGNYVIIPGLSAANSAPYAGTITGASTVCAGSTITLANTVTGGSWSSAGTAIATIGSTGIVTGVAAGTTTISYAVTNSFGTSYATKVVTVNPLPNAGTITGTASVCAGSTTTLSNATTGGAWSSGATGVASVVSTGVVTGIAAGTATISYAVSNSCGSASTTRVVTVNPLPSAGTITGTASVCAGSTTTLSNATTGGAWSSSATGVATVGSTGVVTGVAAGTATISYTVTNGCGSVSTTRVVTVNVTTPSAGTITGTATVTVGSTTTLSNATTGGTWSSSATGVATVGSTGIVTGIAAGTTNISYTVANTCGSAVATRVVTVNASSLTIGATYGGGKIAYILVPGDPGYIAGETHGLIAAPSDQSTGIQWGCYGTTYGTTVGGTSTTLGTGATNTAIVSAACGAGTAARLCADLVLGGYSDWYLPSRDELQKLYINISSIGGFTTGTYWSSSEDGANYAWYVYFFNGNTGSYYKYSTYYVRAVRAF
jgi:uncharacterized protein YjdB